MRAEGKSLYIERAYIRMDLWVYALVVINCVFFSHVHCSYNSCAMLWPKRVKSYKRLLLHMKAPSCNASTLHQSWKKYDSYYAMLRQNWSHSKRTRQMYVFPLFYDQIGFIANGSQLYYVISNSRCMKVFLTKSSDFRAFWMKNKPSLTNTTL